MKIIKSVLAGAMLAMSLAALPVSANAAVSACASNRVCLFQNQNYGGSYYQDGSSSSSPVTINHLWNFGISSWENRMARDAKWFQLQNGLGTGRCMNSNSWNSYVGFWDNDTLQSVTIYTDPYAC